MKGRANMCVLFAHENIRPERKHDSKAPEDKETCARFVHYVSACSQRFEFIRLLTNRTTFSVTLYKCNDAINAFFMDEVFALA